MVHEAESCCYCGAEIDDLIYRSWPAVLCDACDLIACGRDSVEATKRRIEEAAEWEKDLGPHAPAPTTAGYAVLGARQGGVRYGLYDSRWAAALDLLLTAAPGSVPLDRAMLMPVLEHSDARVRELGLQALVALMPQTDTEGA